MKTTRMAILALAIALAACEADDTHSAAEQTLAPVQIGSITLADTPSPDPADAPTRTYAPANTTTLATTAPLTRLAETTDGGGSLFTPGDQVAVQMDSGKTATYTYDGSTWTAEAPL